MVIMVIIEATVNLNSKKVIGSHLEAGTCCTMCIGGNFHLCQLSDKGKELIQLERDYNVKISILTGELSLKNIKVNSRFDLMRGSKVGSGLIRKISEVYVEKDNLEILKSEVNYKEIIKEIVTVAEKMENCIIYEDVYGLISD